MVAGSGGDLGLVGYKGVTIENKLFSLAVHYRRSREKQRARAVILQARFPGILASHLADILHVHPSMLTGVLKRLARKGLVCRRPDPHDRRRTLLGLTAKGRHLKVDADGTVEDAIRAALAKRPESKIRDAAEVLSEVVMALDEVARSGRVLARSDTFGP